MSVTATEGCERHRAHELEPLRVAADRHLALIVVRRRNHFWRRVMLRLAFALSALLLLTACDWSKCGDCMTTGGEGTKIEGSGVMKAEPRRVEPFTSIVVTDVESSLLIIEQTGEESLTVTAEEDLPGKFHSEVKDGR